MCVSFIKEIVVPENWQFEEARKRFARPEVLDCKKIKVMDFRMVCMYHICVIDTCMIVMYNHMHLSRTNW